MAVSADVTTGSKANLSWKRDPAVNNSPVTHSELYWADPGEYGGVPWRPAPSPQGTCVSGVSSINEELCPAQICRGL